MKRMFMLLFCLLMVCNISIPAQAAESIDPTRRGTLEVRFGLDEKIDPSGLQFDLYRVADVQTDGSTQLCSDFASLGMDISLTPTDAWAIAVTNAANLVRRNGLAPEQSACLNENGVAHFPESGKSIQPSIYLVMLRTTKVGNVRINCSPTLAALPINDGGWNYNVCVTPKGGIASSDDYLEVMKVWDDKGFEKQRPEYILVDIYCDDVLVDTQKLTADMQWQYRWEPIPVWNSLGQEGNGSGSDATIEGEHSWYVVERGADKYKVSYSVNGEHRIVITNTIRAETPPSPENKLPQTGALWWPIPILMMSGFCLIYLGRAMEKRKQKDE